MTKFGSLTKAMNGDGKLYFNVEESLQQVVWGMCEGIISTHSWGQTKKKENLMK